MDRALLEHLACPRHQQALTAVQEYLACAHGCRFPIVDGVPVLLLEEARQTLGVANESLRQAREANTDGGLYAASLGISDEERRTVLQTPARHDGVDPAVSALIAATNGMAYRDQVGRLNEYPIPELRLPEGRGQLLLDIGCNWGRWCVAASRKGYRVLGIDPSLGAVMAARRVARQLGAGADFLVADARYLPLKPASVDRVFSYSVLQHLSRADAQQAAAEIGRVLKSGGSSTAQMPGVFGLRCLYHQARRRFREAVGFEVRYWTLASLKRLFSSQVGATTFSVDCYFGIGLQFTDRRFMTPLGKVIVTVSEALRRLSRWLPPMAWVADSVYVTSTKR